MKIGDVIRDESDDTSLIFYTIITELPNKHGFMRGVRVAIDKEAGEFSSLDAHCAANINKLEPNERVLTEVGQECSVCRRPEYEGHLHNHPCE